MYVYVYVCMYVHYTRDQSLSYAYIFDVNICCTYYMYAYHDGSMSCVTQAYIVQMKIRVS
jgi:hypothetical protein